MEGAPEQPLEEFNLALREAVTGAPDAFEDSFAVLPEPPQFETGVTVVTVVKDERVHGMTANAFMSVSLRPPLVLVSIDRRARMNSLLHVGARFGISMLADEQTSLCDYFGGRRREEAPEPEFELVHETPLVQGAIAQLVAEVVRSYWGGDHSLLLGQVECARYTEGKPLLVHGGKHERLLHETPIFSTLPADLLERILVAGVERAYSHGDKIVGAGDTGHELHLILEGSVNVERAGRVVRALSKGDLFGEIAVLDGGVRTADVFAVGETRCLEVPREVVRSVMEADPRAAWELLGVLARRLREN